MDMWNILTGINDLLFSSNFLCMPTNFLLPDYSSGDVISTIWYPLSGKKREIQWTRCDFCPILSLFIAHIHFTLISFSLFLNLRTCKLTDNNEGMIWGTWVLPFNPFIWICELDLNNRNMELYAMSLRRNRIILTNSCKLHFLLFGGRGERGGVQISHYWGAHDHIYPHYRNFCVISYQCFILIIKKKEK